MRITVRAASGPNAAAVRFAIVSLLALSAVFVAVVLMHGMRGTHALATHSPAGPAVSASVSDEPEGHSVDGLGVEARPSVVHDAAVPTGSAIAELGETGDEPLPGLAILTLFMLVPLALLLRGLTPSRVFFARPPVFATGWTRTFAPAVPLRLAVSIDRR
jgi:hypothetical protein